MPCAALALCGAVAGCETSSVPFARDGAALAHDAGLGNAMDGATFDPLDASASEPRDGNSTTLLDGDREAGRPVPCSTRAPTSCPEPAPRYADVMPIFASRCVVCHFGEPNGPWPLDNYRHIADWQDEIRSNLLACSMPPRDSGIALTDEESAMILGWLRCDLPQ